MTILVAKNHQPEIITLSPLRRIGNMSQNNPCIHCGACCAHFRASFYWSEAEPSLGGSVPPELVDKLNDHFVVMKGTNSGKPYCIALEGSIGTHVGCSIYPLRSSVCREFAYSWQDGEHNPRCDQARAAWGLPPLMLPATIVTPEALPLVAEMEVLAELLEAPERAIAANDSTLTTEPPEDPHPNHPGPRSPRAA